MTLLEKFASQETLTKAEKIVSGILQDIEGRKGLGDEIEMIDDTIKEEMLQNWIEIIEMVNAYYFEGKPSKNESIAITESTLGIVVFYEDYIFKGIRYLKEVGRTGAMPLHMALTVYSETPNPASQLLRFNNEQERKEVEEELEINIKDPKWLKQLFECI